LYFKIKIYYFRTYIDKNSSKTFHKLDMNKSLFASKAAIGLLAGALMFSACSKKNPTSINPGKASNKTGMEFGDGTDDKFAVKDYKGQPKAPGLIFIEGGRTVLGSSEEDVANFRDNIERTVSIQSFYMDETEVANINWLEFMHYIDKYRSPQDGGAYHKLMKPDTTVWVSELAFNDSYRDHYLRYPGFRYYPVVGVSWKQAVDYCAWRTAVVNYKLAEDAQIENLPADPGQYMFSYLDSAANATTQGSIPTAAERIPLETGVVVPDYRLPLESEWEYAALALIGVSYGDENQTNKRLYPWDGHSLRNPYGKKMGTFLANFKRGRGDYAGIAGRLNDGSLITDQVYAYPPNDYGLYNMAGNVNEWVFDIYRPMSFQDFDDLNPVRRNDFLDPEAKYQKDNSLINNRARVYKGGSWKDMAYWLSPGTRRYLDEDSATSTIGFRCAMIQAGTDN
jgi:gliding motility-associated lipoprotein GldJ